MSTNMLFIAIIIIFGIFGALRGAIKSIGGLVSAIVSFILARILATPITRLIFAKTDLDKFISNCISVVNTGINESLNIVGSGSAGLHSIGGTSIISDSVNGFFNTTSNIVQVSALRLGSIFVAMLLFTLFMVVCGILVMIINRSFEMIPMGKTINFIVGFACGALKGLLIVIMLYYVLYGLNRLLGLTIPLDHNFISGIIDTAQNMFTSVGGNIEGYVEGGVSGLTDQAAELGKQVEGYLLHRFLPLYHCS